MREREGDRKGERDRLTKREGCKGLRARVGDRAFLRASFPSIFLLSSDDSSAGDSQKATYYRRERSRRAREKEE